jgi:tetratricopeptide (TPR) repeat protein
VTPVGEAATGRVAGWALVLALLPMLAACPDRSMDDAAALQKAGRTHEAAAAYFAIAKRDPANLAAWDQAIELWCRRLVDVGQCLGVLDVEKDRLGNLTRHKDALAEVLEGRARARLDQGLANAALEDLERAEKASPLKSSVFVVRAKAMVSLGRRREAIEALTRARTLDPENEEANALIPSLPDEAPSEEPFGGGQGVNSATKSAPRR